MLTRGLHTTPTNQLLRLRQARQSVDYPSRRCHTVHLRAGCNIGRTISKTSKVGPTRIEHPGGQRRRERQPAVQVRYAQRRSPAIDGCVPPALCPRSSRVLNADSKSPSDQPLLSYTAVEIRHGSDRRLRGDELRHWPSSPAIPHDAPAKTYTELRQLLDTKGRRGSESRERDLPVLSTLSP